MPFHWTGKPLARHYARVSMLLALLVCWFAGTPGWASTIDKVEVHHDRIVLTFDTGVASAASFMLDGPDRIAVDVDGVAPGGDVDTGGPVANIRQAAHDGGHQRRCRDIVVAARSRAFHCMDQALAYRFGFELERDLAAGFHLFEARLIDVAVRRILDIDGREQTCHGMFDEARADRARLDQRNVDAGTFEFET